MRSACIRGWVKKKIHRRKKLLDYLADLADFLAAGIKSGASAYGQWFLNSKRYHFWFWVWFTNQWASLSSYRLDKLTHDPVDEQAVFEVTLSTEQVAICFLWVAMFFFFFFLNNIYLVTTLLMTILTFTWRENKNNVQERKEKYNVTAFTTN